MKNKEYTITISSWYLLIFHSILMLLFLLNLTNFPVTILIINSIYVILVPYLIGNAILRNRFTFGFKFLTGLLVLVVVYVVASVLTNSFYIPIPFKLLIQLIVLVILIYNSLYGRSITIRYSILDLIAFVIFLLPLLVYRYYSQGIYYGLNFDTPHSIIEPLTRIDHYHFLPFDTRIGQLIPVILGTLTVNTSKISLEDLFISLLLIQVIFVFILAKGIMKMVNIFIKPSKMVALTFTAILVSAFAFQGCGKPTACLNFDVLQYSFRGNTVLYSIFPWIIYDYLIKRDKISIRSSILIGILMFLIWLMRIMPIEKLLHNASGLALYYRDYPLYLSLFAITLILLYFNKITYFKIFLLFSAYLPTHAEETIFYIIYILVLVTDLVYKSYNTNGIIYKVIRNMGAFLPFLLLFSLFGIDISPPWYPLPFANAFDKYVSLSSSDVFSNLLLLFLLYYLYIKSFYKKEQVGDIYNIMIATWSLVMLYSLPIFYFYRIFKIFIVIIPILIIKTLQISNNKFIMVFILSFLLGSAFLTLERALYTDLRYFVHGQMLISPQEISTIATLRRDIFNMPNTAVVFVSDYFSMYSFAPIIGGIWPIGKFMTIEEQRIHGNLTMLQYIYTKLYANDFINFSGLKINDFPLPERYYISFLCNNNYNIYIVVWISYRTERALLHFNNIKYLGFVWDVYPWKDKIRIYLISTNICRR